MKVTKEDVRKLIVEKVKLVIDTSFTDLRVCWPGFSPVDVSEDKSPYVNLRILYVDAESVGIGPDTDDRNYGVIQLECCYKEGDTTGMVTINNFIDAVAKELSDTDDMFPVRTYTSRPVTQASGPQAGWCEEGLSTPFWYDSSK